MRDSRAGNKRHAWPDTSAQVRHSGRSTRHPHMNRPFRVGERPVPGRVAVRSAVKRVETPAVAGVSRSSDCVWRRRPDSNRRMEVLQTSALDHLATSPRFLVLAPGWCAVPVLLFGAEGEARTRTPLRAQRPQRCLSTNSNTSALPVGTGRSGGTRTPDLRFWRNLPGSFQHAKKGRL